MLTGFVDYFGMVRGSRKYRVATWHLWSGKGTLWTFTVTYQNRTTGFADEVPYVLALVELEEGVKMFTNIIQCETEEVKIGMTVEVTFVRASEQINTPYFKPVK